MIVLYSNQNNAQAVDTETCPTLPAAMGMGGGYIPMIVMQRRFSDIVLRETEICPTLEAGGGEGGNNLPMIVETFGFKPGQGSAAQGLGYEKEVAPTLNTSSSCGGEYMVSSVEQTSTLMARDYKDPPITNGKCSAIVRRLTPKECERLQGFPDDWTNIGEWIDSKGKKHKDADGPRYKALGNSIALPFWRWLAKRICAQYDRPITIGSLFDGIGGFPLVFEEAGAKAIWASEIEEFPIAVTKKHFPETEEDEEIDFSCLD